MVNPATNAGGLGSIPRQGTKILHAAVWSKKKKKKKSVRARLRRPGYFFTRDKQALVLRMAVRMIDWIYKHKAGGRVWEQADDSW